MPADLVIFDFDGTLADTWRDIATAVNRTLREAELPAVEPGRVKDWVGHGVVPLLRRAVAAADGPVDDARVAALYEVFRRHYDRCCLDTTSLYAGMAAALDCLGDARLAILSNKPQRFLDRIVDGLAMRDRFAPVVGGDALAVQKPDPATIAHVVELAGAPRRVWMVGDSAIDVATGRAYGARTIGCAWGLRPRAELQAAGADALIDHPAQLPAALRS
ncbi:MAG: HAD-IA family hydrolase [Deltaproteobacteria bacterium]|nr:HAD-IA family hydrolase [Deltaproteobacteria bacterium]